MTGSMRAGLSSDQRELVALAAQILVGRTANEQLAAIEASDRRVDDWLWTELADAGLVGIGVPEQYGGAGLGLVELVLLLEQQGRRLAPVPLWETAVLGALPLARFGSDAQCSRWLPGVADGTVRLSAAVDLTDAVSSVHAERAGDGWSLQGRLELVPYGHGADALLVPASLPEGQLGVFLVETGGLRREPVVTTNQLLAADIDLDGVAAEPLGELAQGDLALSWLQDRARIGLAALQLGVADEGIREAASYLGGREQFGRPLATFQAVSQQLGDAYCDVQAMRATLWQAVWAVDHLEQGRNSVDVAAWWATDAAERVQHVVQHLHGGMGADTTYPVHRRLLWTMRAGALLGGASRQLSRLGSAVVEL